MLIVLKISVFILGTIFITFVSRKSLTKLHSHGFYRFFAWELILVLFLLNVNFWFTNPFSVLQIFSWIFLLSSIYPVVEAFRLLRTKGKSDQSRSEEHLYQMEKTTQLITVGIYNYIRHPAYASLLFLAWGIFFKSISITTLILVLISSLFLYLTARAEEKENCEYFGDSYLSYMQQTKMFIPFVW